MREIHYHKVSQGGVQHISAVYFTSVAEGHPVQNAMRVNPPADIELEKGKSFPIKHHVNTRGDFSMLKLTTETSTDSKSNGQQLAGATHCLSRVHVNVSIISWFIVQRSLIQGLSLEKTQ